MYSLYSCFIDLTERIIHSTQLTILQTLDEDKSLFFDHNLKVDYNNEDWFISDFKAYDIYLKVKN